jgi:hypothetical protein
MSINSRLAKLSWRSTPWIKKIKLQQWSRLLDGVAKLNLAVPKIDVVQDLLEGLAVSHTGEKQDVHGGTSSCDGGVASTTRTMSNAGLFYNRIAFPREC